MPAPHHKPSYFNTLSGTSLDGAEVGREPGFLLDSICDTAETFPEWLLDRAPDEPDLPIALSVVRREPETLAVIAFACNGVAGTVTLTPDPSGFVKAVAEIGGLAVFEGYCDRPWEEVAIWPPDANPEPGEEEPGHMSKHYWWVSLSIAGWPSLAAVTTGPWLNAKHRE